MRVTTWNRPLADVGESLGLLDRLRADLIALQECRRPDGDDASVVWRGDNPLQGSAVVSRPGALPIEPVDIPKLHHTAVPAVVRTPEPFMFVGVWTHEPYVRVAWESMRACVDAADGLPVVAAGDFNISPRVGEQKLSAPRFLERMQAELGLVSAYHHFTGEASGRETRATHYHQWNESKPFHLDYCFVPEAWLGRLTGVEIGSFGDWPQSDHRPLTVEFATAT